MAVNSITGSNNQSYQTLLANYKSALLSILPRRCSYLTQILQESSVKELQYIFPALIESIFGFPSGMDWGLLSLDKDLHVKDFEALRRFLMPDGPVLKLVYKFIEEISPKFEFPLSCIPAPSQLMLKDGKVPALYANKLQIVNPGLFPNSLQLNAFEFYFFHFSYYIINPSLKNSMANVNQQETLYAHLLEDYLCSFLPTDGRAVPLFQTPYTIQHSPVMTVPFSSNFGSSRVASDSPLNRSFSRSDYSPMVQKPSLLKKGSVMMVASPSSYGSSQAECWKSETFLLILKEVYLNQNSVDHQQNVLNLPIKTFVPTHYHVWMVRILVKHLHFFFNNSLFSNHLSGHGQIMIDNLGQLKSLGITQLIEREMYCFLKCTFDHWPLDASFRVPLETWLSYIQPWRYITDSAAQVDVDLTFWQKFVNENVFFYTTLLQLVIKRFLRMDFNCPKNAFMLYRVSKVFAIVEKKDNCPDRELRDMIQQAERACIKPSNLGMSPSYIRRSPEKSYSFHRMSFMEGPMYTSLFSEPVYLMVNQLLISVATALQKIQNSGIHPNNKSSSIFSKMCSFLDLSFDGSEDNSPVDIKKTASYLESSINYLCSFFKEVNRPSLDTVPYMSGETSNSFIIHEGSGDGFFVKPKTLTNDDRWQIINKRKKFEVSFEGNPDLQPVRTYEIASFVTFFNKVSEKLNDEYGAQIQRLYHEPTIWGKVCRRVLAKPVTYHSITKSPDMMTVTRTPVHLPPRIYLRFLAIKQLIICFLLLLFFFYMLGWNPVISVILFFIFALFIFAVAILHPVLTHSRND